ncbi:MAG: hypothetical protein DRJ05_19345 [Bacteroidetes bacterium]|nr:MAG: hypothetical protein DRJ05_19345 [Bacteroidota bacterium]
MVRLIFYIMKTILLILSLLCSILLIAQTPEIQWQQCYGTSDTDQSFGIVSTDNGYLITIEIRINEGLTNYHGSFEIWLINVDSIGNMLWEKCYGGSSAESPQKLIKKSENEFYIFGNAGSTDGDVQSGNNGYADLWVVKINGQGDIIWEKTYGCTGHDNPRDMVLTPDGGFVMIDRIGVGGGDVSSFYGSGDVWMCKCGSLGNIEWETTLGNEGLDNCVSLIINSEGNIMMIGAAQKHGGVVECYPDESYGDVWIVELDMQGNIVSQHCYGGSSYDLGVNIIEHENGYYFTAGVFSNDGDISGFHGVPGGNSGDNWVVKTNDQLEILWQKSIGGYDNDIPQYITQTEDGGLIVIGYTSSHDGDVTGNHSWQDYYNDIWVVKLTLDGEIEWEHCYGGENNEMLYTHSVLKKTDNNYVIAAVAQMNSYDVQCELQGDKDVWVFEIDIDDTTGLFDSPVAGGNVKVYPNPASDYVVFEQKGNTMNGKIQIVNIFGEEMETIFVKSKKTVWDCRAVNSGIYFYRMEIEGKVYSGKIVIQ